MKIPFPSIQNIGPSINSTGHLIVNSVQKHVLPYLLSAPSIVGKYLIRFTPSYPVMLAAGSLALVATIAWVFKTKIYGKTNIPATLKAGSLALLARISGLFKTEAYSKPEETPYSSTSISPPPAASPAAVSSTAPAAETSPPPPPPIASPITASTTITPTEGQPSRSTDLLEQIRQGKSLKPLVEKQPPPKDANPQLEALQAAVASAIKKKPEERSLREVVLAGVTQRRESLSDSEDTWSDDQEDDDAVAGRPRALSDSNDSRAAAAPPASSPTKGDVAKPAASRPQPIPSPRAAAAPPAPFQLKDDVAKTAASHPQILPPPRTATPPTLHPLSPGCVSTTAATAVSLPPKEDAAKTAVTPTPQSLTKQPVPSSFPSLPLPEPSAMPDHQSPRREIPPAASPQSDQEETGQESVEAATASTPQQEVLPSSPALLPPQPSPDAHIVIQGTLDTDSSEPVKGISQTPKQSPDRTPGRGKKRRKGRRRKGK